MRALVIVLLLAWAGAGTAQDNPCPPRIEVIADDNPLPATRAALERGRLTILAVGSATTATRPGSPAGPAFPQRMAESLMRRVPGLQVSVTTQGGRGSLAADQLAAIAEHTSRMPRPDLVLWQTGTVDAVRGIEPEEMAEHVADGLARLAALGIDAVLIEPQFSRFLRANTNLDPYLDALRRTAAVQGVPLLRRYDIMRAWAEDGTLDLERTAQAERGPAMERLNTCIGRALGTVVLRNARGQ
jgi:lysophospholipase L1-like esterase